MGDAGCGGGCGDWDGVGSRRGGRRNVVGIDDLAAAGQGERCGNEDEKREQQAKASALPGECGQPGEEADGREQESQVKMEVRGLAGAGAGWLRA
jgi:hypothetical protein